MAAARGNNFNGGAQNQALFESSTNKSAARIDEHARRFACDRCRAQKLRCERKRLNVDTPLRSTPCRRCLKAGLLCTTHAHARIGKAPNEPNAKPQREVIPRERERERERERQNSPFDIDLDWYQDSDDEGDYQRQPVIIAAMDEYAQSTRHLANVSDQDLSKPGNQVLERGDASIIDPNLFSSSQALYQKMPRSDQGAAMPDFNRNPQSSINDQHQTQSGPVVINDHISSLDPDSLFLEDFDFGIDSTVLDDNDGTSWSTNTCSDDVDSSTHQHENQKLTSNLDPAEQVTQLHQKLDSGAPPTNSIRKSTSPSRTLKRPAQPKINDSSHVLGLGQAQDELTQRLIKLTHALMNIVSVDSGNKVTTTHAQSFGSEKSENQKSPLSKLLWSAQQFLEIINEIASCNRARLHSASEAFQTVPGCEFSESDDSDRYRPTGTSSAAEPTGVTRMPRPSQYGTPSLMTMMAIFTAYAGVLQTYDRVFDRIHQSLVCPVRNTGQSQTFLPLLQLDGVKFVSQNSVHIHVTIEVSLQMLNQIENVLGFVVSSANTSSDETRACFRALLHSLIPRRGCDSACASAATRQTINRVRKLMVSSGGFQ